MARFGKDAAAGVERFVPLRETEAIVLRSQPLGETDRLVVFLTRAAGKVRGVAKGARRSRRRFGSSLELLSRVRLSYFEKESLDLTRIETVELLESSYDLQADPERGAVLACIAEVADAFAREEQPDEPFFRLLQATVAAVRDGLELDWAARYFEVWTLRLHGFLPALGGCGGCGAVFTERGGTYARGEGVVLCGRCAGERRTAGLALPPGAIRAAEAILKNAPGALVDRTGEAGLAPLAEMTQAIMTDLTERRFRSYQVLRAIRMRQ